VFLKLNAIETSLSQLVVLLNQHNEPDKLIIQHLSRQKRPLPASKNGASGAV
jgi:hypothetical protein